jgi:hypothetical protein
MAAFPEDRVLGQIVDALQRLGGMATLEEIRGQVARSGAIALPPAALDVVVRLTLQANQNGHGMGCFSRSERGAFGLTATERGPDRPRPTGDIPAPPSRPTPPD